MREDKQKIKLIIKSKFFIEYTGKKSRQLILIYACVNELDKWIEKKVEHTTIIDMSRWNEAIKKCIEWKFGSNSEDVIKIKHSNHLANANAKKIFNKTWMCE